MNQQRWIELREDPELTDHQRRMGDIVFGLIKPFQFPKTYYKKCNQRHASKVHQGLKEPVRRLSNRLKYGGLKHIHMYFTPHYKSVKGVRFHRKLWKKPFKKTVHYGRRHQLIIGPRSDRLYRKYGPWGG